MRWKGTLAGDCDMKGILSIPTSDVRTRASWWRRRRETYEGQQRTCSMDGFTRIVWTALYAPGQTNVGPSNVVIAEPDWYHDEVTSVGRHGMLEGTMLSP